jgi:hypothetical protein
MYVRWDQNELTLTATFDVVTVEHVSGKLDHGGNVYLDFWYTNASLKFINCRMN